MTFMLTFGRRGFRFFRGSEGIYLSLGLISVCVLFFDGELGVTKALAAGRQTARYKKALEDLYEEYSNSLHDPERRSMYNWSLTVIGHALREKAIEL